MNTTVFRYMPGCGQFAAALVFALAASTATAATLPYWDVSPGDGAPCTAAVGGTQGGGSWGSPVAVKNDTFFETSACLNDPSVVYEWNKCSNWNQIGFTDGGIYTTCVGGNYLYVGGSFTNINGQALTNIAKYDMICGEWSAVGDNTMTNIVQAIAVDSTGKVYIGNDINYGPNNWPYGVLEPYLFMVLNGTSWQTVGGGLITTALKQYRDIPPNGVTALVADGTNIYVAGDIDGSSTVQSYEIIKWDGSSFQQMVSSPSMWDLITLSDGTQNYDAGPVIYQLAVSGSNVFAVGSFYSTTTINPVCLARFSTNGGWYGDTNMSLNYQGGGPLDVSGGALAVQSNGKVYVGGIFDSLGYYDLNYNYTPLTDANSIAMWSNGVVSALGSGLTLGGFPANVTGLAADSNAVYVATGGLDSAGGLADSGPNARWLTALNEPCNRLINLMFTITNNPNIMTGPAVVGCSNDYWNTLDAYIKRTSDIRQPTAQALKTALGKTTSVAIWDDSWICALYSSTAFSNVMMQTYHYAPFGTMTNITIQGLPTNGFAPGLPAYYDIYLYACSATNTAYANNAIFSVTPTGCTSGSQETMVTNNFDPNIWLEGGQYVVFPGVPISSNGQNVVISVSAPGGSPVVNGIQILPRQ